MEGSRLSPLQERVLAILAEVEPPWTLTGGAALAAVHLRHRDTRDLDLFWHGQQDLARVAMVGRDSLQSVGLGVDTLQTAATFQRLRVTDGTEVVLVDLVADAVAPLDPPMMANVGTASILVDTVREILANKLCALLGRMEMRDLIDVRGPLDAGGDLRQALTDAAVKDGGFSPLTLAWALRGLQVGPLAAASGMDASEVGEIDQFRLNLISRVVDLADPGDGLVR